MRVSINGVTIGYEDHGAGPAVLLLQGFSFDHSFWKRQIQSLTQAGYRVIEPDLSGDVEGENSRICSIDALSGDIIGLLNYLGIGRAAMVGSSVGSHILNYLLHRCPHRVAGAVFVDEAQNLGDRVENFPIPEFSKGLAASDDRQPVLSLRLENAGEITCHADSPPGSVFKADFTPRLLEFFRRVKRFRFSGPVYRDVA